MNDTHDNHQDLLKAKAEQLSQLKHQLFHEKLKSFDDNHSFTMAHMLLRPGASVAVMGAGDGKVCSEYAQLKPHLNLIGIESNPDLLQKAIDTYDNHNLNFIKGDLDSLPFEENSLHGILNAGTLHRLYSRTGYNHHAVVNALKNQVLALKKGGLLVIRDYVMPPGDRFVLIEMPDQPSYGDTIHDISDPDLLLRFSQTARPLDTSGCEGFFIEEIEPITPDTRLFRLPHKWAVEFIYRLNKRDHWDEELLQEYTFFTPRQITHHLDNLGVRTLYTGPHWDEDVITHVYQGRFRLYNQDGQPMEYPPTTFVTVAQKISASEAVLIQERRPSQNPAKELSLSSVRNSEGEIFDFAEDKIAMDDVIPYRLTEDGTLLVTIRSGVPRLAVGAAPRGTPNLDGKVWSGFMFEPLVIPHGLDEDREGIIHSVLKDLLDLSASEIRASKKLTSYYPAPEYLAKRVNAFAVEIKPEKPFTAQRPYKNSDVNAGFIREYDAQDLLKAIHVGLIPDTRMELAIRFLMRELGLEPDPMEEETEYKIEEGSPENIISPEDIKKDAEQDIAYTVCDERAGSLKHVRSVFVEEGRVQGLPTGIQSVEQDLIIPGKASANTVVILPLTVDSASGSLMIGLEQRKLPVPQRMDGIAVMRTLPSFRLPETVKTISEMKAWVAEKIGCEPKHLRQMGSSYYVHAETGPERIFPMTVFNPGSWGHHHWDFMMFSLLDDDIDLNPLSHKGTMMLLIKAKKDLQKMRGYGYKAEDFYNDSQKEIKRKQVSQHITETTSKEQDHPPTENKNEAIKELTQTEDKKEESGHEKPSPQ